MKLLLSQRGHVLWITEGKNYKGFGLAVFSWVESYRVEGEKQGSRGLKNVNLLLWKILCSEACVRSGRRPPTTPRLTWWSELGLGVQREELGRIKTPISTVADLGGLTAQSSCLTTQSQWEQLTSEGPLVATRSMPQKKRWGGGAWRKTEQWGQGDAQRDGLVFQTQPRFEEIGRTSHAPKRHLTQSDMQGHPWGGASFCLGI